MAMIAVTFGNDADSLQLFWKTLDTPIARKWLRSLESALPHGIFENDRIYNFPNQSWTKERIVQELLDCMQRIETFYPNFFKIWPANGMDLSCTNQLHVYFEKLRGAVEQPSSMFLNAPEPIKTEINRYNILIHRYESQIFGNGNIKRPRIVCSFTNEYRNHLDDQDYDHFSLSYEYGDMMINYPQVGKTFLEVFHDDDDVVTDAGIRPMKYYGAGFKVVFSDFTNTEAAVLKDEFDAWFDKKGNYFNSLGFYRDDKKISLGHLTVAKLIDTGTSQDFINCEIGRLEMIKEVKILEDRY